MNNCKQGKEERKRLLLFVFGLLYLSFFCVEDDYSDLYKKTYRAIVGIFAKKGMMEYYGTGFFINPAGYILTTSTTVPEKPEVIKIFAPNEKIYGAEWIATDNFLEVSIIKIKVGKSSGKKYWKSLILEDSNKVKVGDECLTFTNDFNSIIEHYQVSMSLGTVSGIYTVEPMKGVRSESKYEGAVFETTAAVNPGSDGGPLVATNGKVIGLISLTYAKERYLGVAVPINRLKKFIRKYLARELFGIPISAEKIKFNIGWKLKMSEGENKDNTFIEVAEVEENSPAQAAGLKPNDYIVEFDLFRPKKIEMLEKALELYDYKDVVEVKVLRKEEIKTFYLILQPQYGK